jgi:hypothetical protein
VSFQESEIKNLILRTTVVTITTIWLACFKASSLNPKMVSVSPPSFGHVSFIVPLVGNGMPAVESDLFPFLLNDFSSFVGVLTSVQLYTYDFQAPPDVRISLV